MIADITRDDFCYLAQVNASRRTVAIPDTFLPADSFLPSLHKAKRERRETLFIEHRRTLVRRSNSKPILRNNMADAAVIREAGTPRHLNGYALRRAILLCAGPVKPSAIAASEDVSRIIRGRFTRLVPIIVSRSEEHTSELQSRENL